MASLLVINSSPRSGELSFSKQLTAKVAQELINKGNFINVDSVDLSTDIPPMISDEWINQTLGLELRRRSVLDYSERITQDWMKADVIVVGAPMYNFGPTAYLKGYIDQLVRYGVTFTSASETNPRNFSRAKSGSTIEGSLIPRDIKREYTTEAVPYRGLLDADKVVILLACSSWSFGKGAPMEKNDFLTPWFKAVMDLVGIHRVITIRVDGLEEVELGWKTREEKCSQVGTEICSVIDNVVRHLKSLSPPSKDGV